MQSGYPPPLKRKLITLFSLAAAFMTQLDATIANVALPHMQASTSASREQITWVLTSYIVMAAMFTPLSGWLATRYGRKLIVLGSVIGFTIASALCGLSANFGQLIGFRILQGIMGASLLPMTQAILIDINPPERHGSAMALWGMGAVLGPIVGPVLGGYLTEYLSWRWVFFINIPFGIAATVGLAMYLDDVRSESPARLDLVGFALLAMAVGSLQLMLDRGQLLDWFDSTEIWIEATIAAAAFYLFLVHSFTARNPFVDLALFRDSNYVVGGILGFFLGGLLFGVMALTPPLLAELMGYPAQLVGLVSAPRGVGTMAGMLLGGRIITRVDPRLMIVVGLLICAYSMHLMTRFSLEMDSWPVIISGLIQGFGGGLMFVPITVVVFATIKPSQRNEGAAMNSLIRSMGGAIWISVLQTLTIRNAAVVQSRLVEGVRPDSPAMGLALPEFDFGAVRSIAQMDAEILRQALMVSYIDAFWLLFVACLFVIPLVLLLRSR